MLVAVMTIAGVFALPVGADGGASLAGYETFARVSAAGRVEFEIPAPGNLVYRLSGHRTEDVAIREPVDDRLRAHPTPRPPLRARDPW
jgi:hypothetical protein